MSRHELLDDMRPRARRVQGIAMILAKQSQIGAAILCALLASCSINTYQSPKTLGKNQYEVSVDVNSPRGTTKGKNSFYPTLYPPIPYLSVRYGITDSIDIGIQATGHPMYIHRTINLNVQLVDKENFSLSVLPEIGFFPREKYIDTVLYFGYLKFWGSDSRLVSEQQLSILGGWSFEKYGELIFSVRGLQMMHIYENPKWLGFSKGVGIGAGYGAGGGVGWSLPLGPHLRIHPEITYIRVFAEKHHMFQGGMGIAWGSAGRATQQ